MAEFDGLTVMVIATTLCNKYDEWKNDENYMKIVDLNKNSICVGLKKLYPMIEDKVTQSIALAFSFHFYFTLSSAYNEDINRKMKIDEITVD